MNNLLKKIDSNLYRDFALKLFLDPAVDGHIVLSMEQALPVYSGKAAHSNAIHPDQIVISLPNKISLTNLFGLRDLFFYSMAFTKDNDQIKLTKNTGKSYWWYRRRLIKAGFKIHENFMVYPSFDKPHYLIPIKFPGGVPAVVSREILRNNFAPSFRGKHGHGILELISIISRHSVARFFGGGFIFVATSHNFSSYYRSIFMLIIHEATGGTGLPLMIMFRGTGTAVIPLYQPKVSSISYLKIPLTEPSLSKLSHNWDILKYIQNNYSDDIPSPFAISSGKIGDFQYSVESQIKGRPGTRMRAVPDKMLWQAVKLISHIHAKTKAHHEEEVVEIWQKRLEHLQQCDLINKYDDLKPLTNDFIRRLNELPCTVLAHNDLYFENILFNDDYSISGIIDWDISDKQGIPVIDFLNLIINTNKRYGDGTLQFGIRYLLESEIQRGYFIRYCACVKLEPNLKFWLSVFLFYSIWKISIQAKIYKIESDWYASANEVIKELFKLIKSLELR